MSHDELTALIEHAEEVRLRQPLGLQRDWSRASTSTTQELAGVYEQLEERGIELTDDCGHPEVEETRYSNTEVAAMTTDSLQLFLNEAGR